MTTGTRDIRRIVDLDPFTLPLGLLLPGASVAALGDAVADLAGLHLDPQAELLHLAVQSHLVRIGGATILVDTCIGEGKPRPRRPDWHERSASGYLGRLEAAGCRPEDIDFVLCSHLHADHVGWNTRLENGRWRPTFPNARYVMGERELAHWSAIAEQPAEHPVNHGSYADSVLPVLEAGQAMSVSAGAAIADGASVVALPGHTPGQIGLRLSNAGLPDAVICGDALHSPAQVVRPDWSSAFCTDPAEAAVTRRALLDEAADAGTVLIPSHLRGDGLGVRRGAYGFRPRFCGCDGR